MPFLAECVFCKSKVRVPDHALGRSVSCPRCGNAFTLAPMKDPPKVSKANLCQPDSVTATFPPIANSAPGDESAPPIDDPEAQIQLARWAGALSLFFASAAAICLSFPLLRPATLSLGALSLACGLVGLATARGPAIPAAVGLVVSLAALVIAGFWPYLLTMTAPPETVKDTAPVDTRRIEAVAVDGQPADAPRGWLDASKYNVQQGDFRVHVQSVVVRPPFESARRKAPPPCLHIGLRLSNVGSGGPITYRGWNPQGKDDAGGAILRDNTGRVYKGKAAAPAGGGLQRTLTIEPGTQKDDTLVFEPPPETVEWLRLELPASAAGGAGVMHLEIPKKMLEWSVPGRGGVDEP
jgi:hypothetical protein